MKVHSSSFSTVFGLPLGFYAAGALLLALGLYLKKKNTLFAILVWSLLGVEAYFTFIQIFFINSFCVSCFIFFGLLIACVISSRIYRFKTALIMMLTMFFGAHFVFFFPAVQLKPTLMQEIQNNKANIEIFASPSCTHCEEAISELSKACTKTGVRLIVRPVSISQQDKKKSIQWVSGELFQCGSSTSNRLAEKIVWDNEAEARRLNSGELQVPLILVRREGGFHEIFQGWSPGIQDRILNALAISGMGIRKVAAGELSHLNKLPNRGAICSKNKECHEKN